MSHAETLALLDQAHGFAREYIEGIEQRPVYPSPEALEALAAFDEGLPERGVAPGEMLSMLHRLGSPATVAQTGGRYFGFVNGGVLPGALAARWLADTWDQNAALQVMSPVTARLESVCERWLVSLFGLAQGTAAGFVSGTSMALVCGLAAARHELLGRRGWDVNTRGLFGAEPIRVVVGAQTHAAVLRALAILGLGSERVETVDVDDQGRMRVDALPPLDSNTLLIVQAGNVASGAFDPLQPLCETARRAGAWTHVDGAFGLWAGAARATAHLYAGAEVADSWSVDAHKTLNAPYDCGVVLCANRQALVDALQASGAYLQWGDERDGMAYAPEMSRRARVVELWAALKTLGREGVDALVTQLCERAAYFAEELAAADFEVLNEVVFNQVLVRCETPEVTNAALAALQHGGECWCGGTQWQGAPAIRVSVCSAVTTPGDVDRSVAAFRAARDAARSGA